MNTYRLMEEADAQAAAGGPAVTPPPPAPEAPVAAPAAPSQAPAPPMPRDEPETVDQDFLKFVDTFDTDDDESFIQSPAAATPRSAEPPSTPVEETPLIQPQAASEPTPAPIEAPAVPAAPAAPAAPEPTPQQAPTAPGVQETPQETPEQIRQRIETARSEYYQALTKHYAIDLETAQRVLTEPEKVLPELLSRVHLNATEQAVPAAIAQMQQIVPMMLQQMVEAEKNKAYFYKQWPKLDHHRAEVEQMLISYSQMPQNRGKPWAQVTTEVGAMASMHFKLPLMESFESTGALPQPAAPPAAAVSPPPPPPVAGAPISGPPTQDSNPFVQFANAILEEDDF
jgi:hypothetical protein